VVIWLDTELSGHKLSKWAYNYQGIIARILGKDHVDAFLTIGCGFGD
jgi:hypothetical protein